VSSSMRSSPSPTPTAARLSNSRNASSSLACCLRQG
jgi:hypothetical protein